MLGDVNFVKAEFSFFFFNMEGYQGIFEGWKNSIEREKLKTEETSKY